MLRWLSLLILSTLCLGGAQPQHLLLPDSLKQKMAAGVPVRVVDVDLTDKRVQVSVQTARGMPRGAESFSTLLARTHPTIAINGTYFSTIGLAPIGDIMIRGKLLYRGGMGTALAITPEKQAIIQRVGQSGNPKWKGYDTVLACGPALVLNGKVDVTPTEEGFQDPHIMGSTPRMGVGLTPAGHLLLAQTLASVDFRKWAEVMLALGCRDAMNLDAGASAALYYRGKTLRSPGRDLTNILAVYVDRPLPDLALLAPGPEIADEFAANGRHSSHASDNAKDPGNSSSPKAVSVRLCGDTFQKATDFCPTTVLRRVVKGKRLPTCRLHSSPQSER